MPKKVSSGSRLSKSGKQYKGKGAKTKADRQGRAIRESKNKKRNK